MEPKLREIYGLQGNWREIVSQVMHFREGIDGQFGKMWDRNRQIAAENGSGKGIRNPFALTSLRRLPMFSRPTDPNLVQRRRRSRRHDLDWRPRRATIHGAVPGPTSSGRTIHW